MVTISEKIIKLDSFLLNGSWIVCPFYVENPNHISIFDALDYFNKCDIEECESCGLIEHHWLQYCDCPKETK